MKTLVLATLSLFSAMAAAASPSHYMISAKVFVDGKLVSSPRVATLENEEAQLSQASEKTGDSLLLKLVASDNSKDAINLKIKFQYHKGTQAISSASEVVLAPGEEITLAPSNNSTEPNADFKIELVATRE